MGVQNEPPQDVLHWYVDYFELKVTLASGSRETSSLPRTGIRGLVHNKRLSEITYLTCLWV